MDCGDAGCPVPDKMSLWDRLRARSEYPLDVLLSITNRCPLSCSHCYIAHRSSVGELTTAEIVSLLEQLAGLGVLRLTLTGGEPAVREDLLEIAAEARRLRFALVLKTSAVLFNGDDIEALRRAGVVELHASIYHPSAEHHDRFVGRDGAWRRAVAALDRFRALGGVARANTPVMAWNVEALPELVSMYEEHGWDYAVDPRIVAREDGCAEPRGLRVSDSALDGLLRDGRITAPHASPRAPQAPVCSVGRGGAYITAQGDVMPCPNLPLVFGNVRELPFARIWRESPERQRVLRLTWGDSPQCAQCAESPHCMRCPGDAFTEHGDMRIPSSLDCRMGRAIGRVRG